MLCHTCGGATQQTRSTRKFCSNACRTAYHRGRRPSGPAMVTAPVLHCGRFQAYADHYAEQVDVILTDTPYEKKTALPLMPDLVAFAMSTLKPGGYLIWMPGSRRMPEACKAVLDSPLEFIDLIAYRMIGGNTRDRLQLSTGPRELRSGQKLLVWCQKPAPPQPRHPGRHRARRLAGGTNCVEAHVDPQSGSYRDMQSLAGFQALVTVYTTPQDVVCDPCMGFGTTILAAVTRGCQRVIGIECDRGRFDYAREQVALAQQQGDDYRRPLAPPQAS
jgi:hypothetical protein